MKKFIKYIFVFILLIIIFNILMLLGSLFPSSLLEKHTKESADILLGEGNRFEFKNIFYQNNNYTDAIMINTAFSIDNKNPVYSYMSARKNYNPELTKEVLEDAEAELISFDSSGVYNPVGELSEFTDGKIDTSITYARYWHGYLPILRTLLIFFNVSEIRLLMLAVFILLLVYFVYLLKEKFNKTIATIFAYSLIMYGYFYVSYSLESTPIFLVMIISSIILLKRIEKIKDFSLFIFIVGCVSCFVDFLTVPLITLAIPLYIYILYYNKSNKDFNIKTLFKYIILWGIGYGITWFSKWIIYDLLYKEGLISSAIYQVLYRAGVKENLTSSFLYAIFVLSLRVIIYFSIFHIANLMYFIIKRKCITIEISKDFLKKNAPIIIIMFLPFIWYFALKNHTVNHWWFMVFRNMLITLIGMLLFINNVFQNKKEKESLKEKCQNQ